jgi:hypothetical protein
MLELASFVLDARSDANSKTTVRSEFDTSPRRECIPDQINLRFAKLMRPLPLQHITGTPRMLLQKFSH